MTCENKQLCLLAAALATMAAAPASQAAEVGYWGFEEAGGTTVVDSSGSGNTGTLVNAQAGTRVAGKVGQALYFDGSTGSMSTYVKINDSASLALSGALTFAAWVHPDGSNRDAPVFAKEGYSRSGVWQQGGDLAYWFGLYPATHFGLLLDGDGYQPWQSGDATRQVGDIVPGVWTFIASTWDGQTIRHYVNGQLLTTQAYSGTLYDSPAALTIGVNSGYIGAPNATSFKGAVDEVRIFNTALDAAGIQALYAQQTPVPEPGGAALLLAGLGLLARLAQRRRVAG